MFTKTSWMSKGFIAKAMKFLQKVKDNEFGEYTKAEVDGADEGLANLDGAQAGYLIYLIPQNHPDRVMAVILLTQERI